VTSKERVLAAANHKPASGRVPITFDAEKEIYEALHQRLGTSSREELFDRLHCDTWMVSPNISGGSSQRDEQGCRTSLWGWKTRTANYSGGSYEELAWSPLAGKDDPAEIDRHAWPRVDDLSCDGMAAKIDAHKDRAIISPPSWGAYFIASFVRGMEDILIDLAANHAYAERLIGAIAERVHAFQEKTLAGCRGIDILYMADDYCSQLAPMFSPQAFRRFVVPYLRRSVEIAHRHGCKFLLHCCGAVRPLLPDIIDCGVDMLEPIQIRAEGMEPGALKRDFGRHICFYGGVDLQQVLCRGTPQTVADEVRRLIDILGAGGGYILGPGHTYIQVDAPLDNILAMYETAASHGAT
jgi:uroporphyrinogen decarboxylase